jgi:hypothetical protein
MGQAKRRANGQPQLPIEDKVRVVLAVIGTPR